MTNKGPGLFSDFDILNKDYSTEQKFSISSQSDTGVMAKSSPFDLLTFCYYVILPVPCLLLAKKGGLSAGDVGAQYKYKKSTVNVKVDTESNIAASITVTDILPSTKTIATCRYPDYNAGKIEVQYFHEHASVTTAVDLKKSPNVDISATIGTPFIAFGTGSSYKVDSRAFTKYNAGVSLTKPNYGASVILTDKGDAVKATYFHHWDQEKRGVAVGEFARKFSTNENTLTVGGSYAIDPHTLVKAKLNNHGNLGTLVQHELAPKSFLTLSGSFDTLAMEKRPRFGLTLSLKP